MSGSAQGQYPHFRFWSWNVCAHFSKGKKKEYEKDRQEEHTREALCKKMLSINDELATQRQGGDKTSTKLGMDSCALEGPQAMLCLKPSVPVTTEMCNVSWESM